MTWDECVADWTAICERMGQRFPRVRMAGLHAPPENRDALVALLTDLHDLTPLEAAEELADFLHTEALLRSLD